MISVYESGCGWIDHGRYSELRALGLSDMNHMMITIQMFANAIIMYKQQTAEEYDFTQAGYDFCRLWRTKGVFTLDE